ncbi:hypothetical protein FOMPIDRAFT_1059432 [Fomitopsis schrenkii]|uniref:Malate dehydrogenase n=1 Tax=Fomitopsis schrenkii TaxID=2126942 RepID=S8EG95_FOMSC|nr:hypothetical protein FOMPIDRAFT_1059432 [Fomitopsis schrenkii]
MFIRAATACLSGVLGQALYSGHADCDVSSFAPSFPSNQTQLALPTSETPKFLGVGFGIQNYTCSSSSTYTSVGAVAELIDFSCNTGDANFDTIQNDIYDAWNSASQTESIQDVIASVLAKNPPRNLGQHYFVTNPVTGQGVSPKWDFTSSGENKGDANAYVIGKGAGNLPSPDDSSKDVAWLKLQNVQGELADTIYRFGTVGGQPPSSCTPGQDADVSVNYVAKYIFYG